MAGQLLSRGLLEDSSVDKEKLLASVRDHPLYLAPGQEHEPEALGAQG